MKHEWRTAKGGSLRNSERVDGGWVQATSDTVRVRVRVRGQRFTVTLKSRMQWFCISWHAQCLHVTTKQTGNLKKRRAYQVHKKKFLTTSSQWCACCCGLTGASRQSDGTIFHSQEGRCLGISCWVLSVPLWGADSYMDNQPVFSSALTLSDPVRKMFQILEARSQSSPSNAHIKRDVLLFLATF